MLEADHAATPDKEWSIAGPAGLGLATRLHALPFQCRISVRLEFWPPKIVPTAQALVAEMAATPVRESSNELTFGGRAIRHALPFQCSMSIWGDSVKHPVTSPRPRHWWPMSPTLTR